MVHLDVHMVHLDITYMIWYRHRHHLDIHDMVHGTRHQVHDMVHLDITYMIWYI